MSWILEAIEREAEKRAMSLPLDLDRVKLYGLGYREIRALILFYEKATQRNSADILKNMDEDAELLHRILLAKIKYIPIDLGETVKPYKVAISHRDFILLWGLDKAYTGYVEVWAKSMDEATMIVKETIKRSKNE